MPEENNVTFRAQGAQLPVTQSSISNLAVETSDNPLSRREKQVLGLLAQGRIQKEVAQDLRLSLASVRTYVKRIREKLGGRTLAEILVAYGRSLAESGLAVGGGQR